MSACAAEPRWGSKEARPRRAHQHHGGGRRGRHRHGGRPQGHCNRGHCNHVRYKRAGRSPGRRRRAGRNLDLCYRAGHNPGRCSRQTRRDRYPNRRGRERMVPLVPPAVPAPAPVPVRAGLQESEAPWATSSAWRKWRLRDRPPPSLRTRRAEDGGRDADALSRAQSHAQSRAMSHPAALPPRCNSFPHRTWGGRRLPHLRRRARIPGTMSPTMQRRVSWRRALRATAGGMQTRRAGDRGGISSSQRCHASEARSPARCRRFAIVGPWCRSTR
jgi:hypothetical protein